MVNKISHHCTSDCTATSKSKKKKQKHGNAEILFRCVYFYKPHSNRKAEEILKGSFPRSNYRLSTLLAVESRQQNIGLLIFLLPWHLSFFIIIFYIAQIASVFPAVYFIQQQKIDNFFLYLPIIIKAFWKI
jgi:hypothetical protein